MWAWTELFSRIRDSVYFQNKRLGYFFGIQETRVFSSYAKNQEMLVSPITLASLFLLKKGS